MLTRDGAKVLDFGLAKGPRREPPAPAADAPTVTRAADHRGGSLVGTMPYMAPEQLEGKEADARSDIWALGACSTRWRPERVRSTADPVRA